MAMTDRPLNSVLERALERAQPLLDRFGILSSPVRDVLSGRRVITIKRPSQEVESYLGHGSNLERIFAGHAVSDAPFRAGQGRWRLAEKGEAEIRLRPGREEQSETEVILEVRLCQLPGGVPRRYGDNAGVMAIRAAHRAKGLIETGEAATLANNPAGRSAPDPYGD
jgi:hypothetical protein